MVILPRNSEMCRPVPPFWWKGPSPGQPVGSEPSNAYETAAEFSNVEKVDVLNEMKLDDVGEYLPGEVSRSRKLPLQVGPACGAT